MTARRHEPAVALAVMPLLNLTAPQHVQVGWALIATHHAAVAQRHQRLAQLARASADAHP